MDKTTTQPFRVFKETRFRTPSGIERQCGLWVDRIGGERQTARPLDRLRILGQYAAVAVENGAGRLVTQTRGVWPAHPGDVMLLSPGEAVTYGPDEMWDIRWIVWSGEEVERVFDLALRASDPPVVHQAATAVHEALFVLARCMDTEGLASVLECKAALLNLMADLIRGCHERPAYQSTRASLERVMHHIRTHLDSRLSVPKLADMCHLSVSRFRCLFRRHTGCSPIQFITAQRISRAKQLLIQGASIKAAGADVGYADPFYFMRVFKKMTGRSAGRFVAETLQP